MSTSAPALGAEEIPGLRRSFGQAVSWSYFQTGGRMFMTFIVSMLLARLLGPEAFGVIAMANVYIYFVEMLTRQGLAAAVIQRSNLTRLHLDTAFWMVLAAVSVLVPITIGLSGWWASVNAVPELRPVIIALTPVLLLKGLSVVQEAELRRRLAYRELAIRTNVATALGGLGGVLLALGGWGVWALVGQQVLVAVTELVMLWRLSDWRPRLRFSSACGRDLLGFSAYSGLAAVGSFLQMRIDALLIGLLFGPTVVGLYRFASRLADMAVEAAGGAIHAVSLPELSKFTLDQTRLNERFREILKLVSIVTVPLVGVLALTSEPLIRFVGPEWQAATVAVQVMCVSALIQVFAGFLGPALQASGRPGILATMSWAAAVFSGGAFILAGIIVSDRSVADQTVTLAVVRGLALAAVVTALLPVLHRTIGLRARDIALPVLPTVAAGSVAVIVLELIFQSWEWLSSSGALWSLLIRSAVGGVVLAATMLVVEPRARLLLTGFLRRFRRDRTRLPESSPHA